MRSRFPNWEFSVLAFLEDGKTWATHVGDNWTQGSLTRAQQKKAVTADPSVPTFTNVKVAQPSGRRN